MIERGNYIYLTYTDFNKAYPEGVGNVFDTVHEQIAERYKGKQNVKGRSEIEQTLNAFLKRWYAPQGEADEAIKKMIVEETLNNVNNGKYKNAVSLVKEGVEFEANSSAQETIRKLLNGEIVSDNIYEQISKEADTLLNEVNDEKERDALKKKVKDAISQIEQNTEDYFKNKKLNKKNENPYAFLRDILGIPYGVLKGALGEVLVAVALTEAGQEASRITSEELKKILTGQDRITVTNKNKSKKSSSTTVKGKGGSVEVTTSAATVDVTLHLNNKKVAPYRISVKNYKDTNNIHIGSDIPFETMLDSYNLNQEQKFHIYNLLVQHKKGSYNDSHGYDYVQEAMGHIREMAYQQALIGRSQKNEEQANLFVVINGDKAIVKTTGRMGLDKNKQFSISGLKGVRGFQNKEEQPNLGRNIELAWQRSEAKKKTVSEAKVSVSQRGL